VDDVRGKQEWWAKNMHSHNASATCIPHTHQKRMQGPNFVQTSSFFISITIRVRMTGACCARPCCVAKPSERLGPTQLDTFCEATSDSLAAPPWPASPCRTHDRKHMLLPKKNATSEQCLPAT
jgi:hypothetical protein